MSTLKTLKFGPGLMARSIGGVKKITIRRYRKETHDLKAGQAFFGEFADGLRILLQATADTFVKTFADLTDEEAQEDGFRNSDDALDRLGQYYPDLAEEDEMAIIRYEIWNFAGIPVVSLIDS